VERLGVLPKEGVRVGGIMAVGIFVASGLLGDFTF